MPRTFSNIIIFLLFPIGLFSQSPKELRMPVIFAIGENILTQGEQWIADNKPDSAMLLAQNLLNKARLDPFQERQALFLLGKAHFALGAPEAAIVPLQKSLVLAQKSNDNSLLLKSHIVLAAALGDKFEPSLDSSIFYLANAKDLAERLRDTINLAKVYIGMSNIYYLKEEFKEALKTHYQCEVLLKNTNFKEIKAINSYGKANNLMEIYSREEGAENLKGAYEAYKIALHLFQELKLTQYEAHAHNALGACMLYMENFKDAENEVKTSIKLGEALENDEVLLNGYYTLTSIYEMQGNATEAVKSLEGLKSKLEKMGVLGDPTFLKDQFSNSDLSVSLALINAKINNFNKQIENEQATKDNQRLYNRLWVAALLIVLIGSISLYIRQKNKTLKILAELLHLKNKSLQTELVEVLTEVTQEEIFGSNKSSNLKENGAENQYNIDIAKSLKHKISNNDVGEVIEVLLGSSQEKNTKIFNEVILLKSRLMKNHKENNQGLIDQADFRLEELRIIKYLIELIDDLYNTK